MKQHQHGLITEINMTPFVDIVLVILIIFMLTATVLLTSLNGSAEIEDVPEVSLPVRKAGRQS